MRTLVHTADLPPVGDEQRRGQAIQQRLDRLGISDREFHEQSGIDRKTLRRAVAGEERVRASTYSAIEAALDRLEKRVRPDVAVPEAGLVTFELSGDFGVEVVVKGPVENLDELEASVERLLRRMRGTGKP